MSVELWFDRQLNYWEIPLILLSWVLCHEWLVYFDFVLSLNGMAFEGIV